MKKDAQSNTDIRLDTPSKITINIYRILAILLIIIPESLAELMLSIRNKAYSSGLEENNDSWEIIPELKLSTMSLKDLREMARSLKLQGYASENRANLSKRLLKKLSKNYYL